ncbi:hypothetical protein HAALTHF_34090n [Vreelandella aquamarina]|nr:hypothetical protein HAALTHF_34090n [Halomonas axialensis]
MSTLSTQINPRSDVFQANEAAMQKEVSKLRELTAVAAQGGGANARARHESRGKLFVRDRIDHLIDEGSPFLEFSALAAHHVYDSEVPAAGVITGIGRVSGVECVIVANDATVKGGTYFPLTVKKAPACPGNCPQAPPAVHLLGGFWRCLPAPPGRSLP